MRKSLLLLLLLIPVCSLAQVKITGKVINMTDTKPVPNASVFLNNAQVGNKTADDGTFTLSNVKPGKYDFIISIVGYETYTYNLQAGSVNIDLGTISIIPKTFQLNEVKIRPDPNREKYYAIFRQQFLGSSENAAHCKILNSDVLDFDYDNATRILKATSHDFMEVENKALGYRIRYKLTNFNFDPSIQILYYEGISTFEDLKGSEKQKRKWNRQQQQAYLGSSMHFYRAAIKDSLTSENFVVMQLIRKPNPNYKGGPNNKYLQSLVNKPLDRAEFFKLTDQEGLFAIGYTDCLYVMYTKKAQDPSNNSFQAFNMPNNATTIVSFAEPHAFFDNNGIITTPHAIIYEGDWGINRVAEMLPVDYEPVVEKK
ncbi:carboxypeptidase-like regulatory domain-containing protein [Mucilaginibacter sp. cycad4]|uniref:carboxypeptidase-like regulatory domain-containing protein n=1 Tax=Mucilaginibacter sp. cycad4 TaxID=3342096 RepID=UPI002AAA923F|nr:carboxypeptidase-like regulatory domain-containing protein [Mucilaginibacter gossypii]WPV00183.1 carboxypeptidase-like regulatory domain-containing protein [Mucilaginibacter gossypii]